MTEPNVSEDVMVLLAGLGVDSIRKLRLYVEFAQLAETEDFVTAERLRVRTVGRPDLGPGWREDSSGEVFYSSAWL